MNATQIIEMIREAGAETNQDVIYVLEDGQALSSLGLTDYDQEAVEEAHDMMNQTV